jgi:hypothetical protein
VSILTTSILSCQLQITSLSGLCAVICHKFSYVIQLTHLACNYLCFFFLFRFLNITAWASWFTLFSAAILYFWRIFLFTCTFFAAFFFWIYTNRTLYRPLELTVGLQLIIMRIIKLKISNSLLQKSMLKLQTWVSHEALAHQIWITLVHHTNVIA